LAFVGDVAEGPGGGFGAGRFFEDFEADVDGAVAVIDGGEPVGGAGGVDEGAFDIEVGFGGGGVVGVGFGEGEGDVEEDELFGVEGEGGEEE
jgi:hypothetical protein